MKRLLLPFAVLCLAIAVRADLTLVQEIEDFTGGANGAKDQVTLYVSGSRLRLDKGQTLSSIILGDKKITYSILHETRQYVQMPHDLFKGLGQALGAAAGAATQAAEEMKIEATDKQETISGHPCRLVRIRDSNGTLTDLWVTRDAAELDTLLGEFKSLMDFWTAIRRLRPREAPRTEGHPDARHRVPGNHRDAPLDREDLRPHQGRRFRVRDPGRLRGDQDAVPPGPGPNRGRRRPVTFHFGPWDYALVAVVSLQTVAIAYTHHAQLKALLVMLPFPFTVATLALGARVDATHVWGLGLFLAYIHGVRFLSHRVRVPIGVAIVAGMGAYAAGGWLLGGQIPRNTPSFLLACAGMLVIASLAVVCTPHRDEPGHRTSLPVWIKLPIIVAVILMLVVAKQNLRGFMTTFPMVMCLGAYETRHSLWTMCRQTAKFALLAIPLMAVSRYTEPHLGLGRSLAAGWVVFLVLLLPIFRRTLRRMEASDA